jgi:protoporphyrinogen IX oxidase
MEYSYIKALHIIFVVTWFAGLFYTPRLFVYAVEANEKGEIEKNILLSHLLSWQKRLWYGITTPSALLTLLLGGRLFSFHYPEIPKWLWIKLLFVIILYLYHLATQHILKQQQNRIFKYSSNQMRLWNEIPTLLLFAIVFQVILKEAFTFTGLISVLAGLIFLIYAGFSIYRHFRTKPS